MSPTVHPELDLTLSRIIRASRAKVWDAFADPGKLVQWWIPRPMTMRVVAFDLRAGGAFETTMSEDGGRYTPHIQGCFLAVDPEERLVFTETMTADWRPSQGFITAHLYFRDHADGTEYFAHVMHKDGADRAKHEELGFFEGWGTVARQLAEFVE